RRWGRHSCLPFPQGRQECLPHRADRFLAFTLVELMVSIALVLLLVLGINAVFNLSAKTVGTGQAVSEAQRQLRNAEQTWQADFSSFVGPNDLPLLFMQMMNQPAFLN